MKVRFETAAGKDSKNTAVVEDSLSPFWDETMTFDFDIASQYQLDTQKAYIEVWDSDRVKDEQIGSFELGSIVLAFLSRCLAMVCVFSRSSSLLFHDSLGSSADFRLWSGQIWGSCGGRRTTSSTVGG